MRIRIHVIRKETQIRTNSKAISFGYPDNGFPILFLWHKHRRYRKRTSITEFLNENPWMPCSNLAIPIQPRHLINASMASSNDTQPPTSPNIQQSQITEVGVHVHKVSGIEAPFRKTHSHITYRRLPTTYLQGGHLHGKSFYELNPLVQRRRITINRKGPIGTQLQSTVFTLQVALKRLRYIQRNTATGHARYLEQPERPWANQPIRQESTPSLVALFSWPILNLCRHSTTLSRTIH